MCNEPGKKLFQSYGDKNDSQILFDNQDSVFQSISAVLNDSSQSTNVGEQEETLLQSMGIGNVEEEEFTVYTLRSRVVKKFGELRESQKRNPPEETPNFNSDGVGPGDGETEVHSQESVSMLEECYNNAANEFPELMETCLNSEPEEVNIYSDEEMEETAESTNAGSAGIGSVEKVENATQTEIFSPGDDPSQEKQMIKHAKFISSVVRLKTALSSRKTISDRKLRSIIYGQDEMEGGWPDAMEVDSEIECQGVPKETIDYLLRSSDVENVFRETVQVLLRHLERTLGDFGKVACCWKNSVYEMAVEILIRAVDNETGVWKMVDQFLCRSIESILNNEDKSKNLTLESKANFIISFCHSTHLSCTVVNFTVEKLKMLKMIERRNERVSTRQKYSWAGLAKNSYYLLRILESALGLLKAKVEGGSIENVVKQPEGKYYNVLEMWKKHWNRDEVAKGKKSGHEWEVMVSEWCRELDEILLHCVKHVPVLSMAVERCGESAKEILNTCHPDLKLDSTGSQ